MVFEEKVWALHHYVGSSCAFQDNIFALMVHETVAGAFAGSSSGVFLGNVESAR